VFLLDEPLSNLDALLRERVRHELRELFRKVQAPVIYVTHDQTEAMTLADRVAVLDRGKLQQVGTPEELYRRPANRFVGSFIGSPSMNLFAAELEGGTFRLGGARIDSGTRASGAATIGIRPEALQPGDGIAGRIGWVESLGANFLVGVETDEARFTALLRSRPAADIIHLTVEPGHIHVFDKGSGTSLRCSDS
jgi:multiple sugar transport system ATP-binding protein